MNKSLVVTTDTSEDGKIFTVVIQADEPLRPMEILKALESTLVGMCDKLEEALKTVHEDRKC